MAKGRDIQRRIKSISSTKKITKAMEMVSAAKMRKAIEAVLKTRSYANLSWATVLNLSRTISASGGKLHPLLEKRKEVKNVGIVLISSNRGMCGGFNTNLINKVHESIQKHHFEGGNMKIGAEIILVGKRGEAIYRYHGYKIAAEFTKNDIVGGMQDVIPVSQMIIKDYLSGRFDKILVAYTDFVNAAKQVPRIKQLLPIDITTQDEYLGIVGKDTRLGIDKKFISDKEEKYLMKDEHNFEYLFEPDPETVLNEMLPRLLEIQMFQALLESTASVHSARMNTMQQATDAATEMVDELTLFYNKARQAGITSELAEISAGANALQE